MNTNDLHSAAIALRKGEIHRLRGGLGRRIETLSGCLWVTIDRDRRDIVLEAGRGFRIDRHGDALISAIDDARFVVLAPVIARVG